MKAESVFRDLSSVYLMSYHMQTHFNVVCCESAACVMGSIIQISFMHCQIDLSQEEPSMILYTVSLDHDKPKVAIAES